MPDELMEVFIYLRPNWPKNDQTRADRSEELKHRFDQNLPAAVERTWELPPLILKKPFGDYVELLTEARELFISGYFYSCVAMCGIVGERLIKDALRASVVIQTADVPMRPTDKAFDQLERVEVSGIIQFLKEAKVLGNEAADAAKKLGELRNQYAHARGKNPSEDAINAIKLLHTLVDDTVSVLKDFEIKDGRFVQKSKPLGAG
jgi:hypothetical protein